MDYAFLPDSLEDLCDQDRENLCRLMTENRRAKWEKSHPGLSLKENRTYFSKAAGRTCIVEEEVTPGAKAWDTCSSGRAPFFPWIISSWEPGTSRRSSTIR